MTLEEEVAWCEQLWNSINDGGVWAIPRSGLIFQKSSEERRFSLALRMPHEEEMLPLTAEELHELQDEEIEAARERFSLLGIEVTG